MNTASDWSLHGLSTLNAILGSSESSRAVAAILTLMKDEFRKPEPGGTGESAGYIDLFAGTVGFVLLQRWGRRKTQRQFVDEGGEEIIWDAVIDDKGFRADVVGTQSHKTEYFDGIHTDAESRIAPSVSFVSPGGDGPFEVIPRDHSEPNTPGMLSLSLSAHAHSQLTDEEIQDHIMSQLPEGAHATITSETISAKTIKVDIFDTEMADISAPPGTVMIAEKFNHDSERAGPSSGRLPQQTVVFQTALNRTSSSRLKPLDRSSLTDAAKELHDSTMEDSTDKPVISSDDGSPQEDLFMSDTTDVPETKIPESQLSPARKSPAAPSPLGTAANQKKPRKPPVSNVSQPTTDPPTTESPSKTGKRPNLKPRVSQNEPKMVTLRKAFKNFSPTQSPGDLKEDTPKPSRTTNKTRDDILKVPRVSQKQSGQAPKPKSRPLPPGLPHLSTDASRPSVDKSLPRLPQPQGSPASKRNSLTVASSRDGQKQNFYSVREQRRDSLVSHTDTFSVRSVHSRPGSPSITRTHMKTASGGLGKTMSERDVWASTENLDASPDPRHHRRSRSFVPSLYSVGTKDSDGNSLIIAPKSAPRKSIFEDHENVLNLSRDGKVPGIFPDNHLVKNVRRFVRFSSASYGKSFLRIMGLTDPALKLGSSTELKNLDVHHEHDSFSQYTGLPADTIILSSFVDPHGVVTPLIRNKDAALPLVHYISIDHESRAVVLTCRGTLGFEDVLTDMMCDYDDLYWRGNAYKVHKGIHASARRLLSGTGSRVMATLKAALEEYPDFGLVLCGHSLGGAVASILAVLISEPNTNDMTPSLFLTVSQQKLLAHPNIPSSTSPPIDLPSGRPIHVYAYGPPATMSPSLRIATRGLITTIVNGSDIVPSLSLGLLYDFRSISLNLKSDTTDALSAIKNRVYERIRHSIVSHFYVDQPPPPDPTAGDGVGEDAWAWAALKTLRAGMSGEKLVPPGEVFVIETTRVFDRSSSDGSGDYYPSLGRAATRVTMKYIRDVDTRFGEIRFGSRMFSDHSPGRYEASLKALNQGILEDE